MKYWIIPDTHFGHDNLCEYSGRPEDFSEKILKGITDNIVSDGVLIHLGDVCIGEDELWHQALRGSCYGSHRWLVRGNHDRKSDTWYLDNGWDVVADSILIKRFGMNILFSHKPKEDLGYFDINIHGHFHNTTHDRHPTSASIVKENKHILIMLEHHYQPQNLETIIQKHFKTTKAIIH